MEAKKDKNGFIFYDEVPQDFRQATREDFFSENGKILTGLAFLVKSYHNGEKYQAYRTTASFNIREIVIWLDDSRVFVLG